VTPIVTITRSAWHSLSAMALGHAREGGGLLMGRSTSRGNVIVEHVLGTTHEKATKYELVQSLDERARAKRAAHAVYRPLEAVGEWHSHVFDSFSPEAMPCQLSGVDFALMLDGGVEIVVVVCPMPTNTPETSPHLLQRAGGGNLCRAEAWFKYGDEAKPCEIRLR
jgi:hypothetical protein